MAADPIAVFTQPVEDMAAAAIEFCQLVRGSASFSGVLPMVVEDGMCIALTGTGPLGTENAHRIAAALNLPQMPTEAMLNAGFAAASTALDDAELASIWSAMLAAGLGSAS